MHWYCVHVKFDPILEMMIEYLIYKNLKCGNQKAIIESSFILYSANDFVVTMEILESIFRFNSQYWIFSTIIAFIFRHYNNGIDSYGIS